MMIYEAGSNNDESEATVHASQPHTNIEHRHHLLFFEQCWFFFKLRLWENTFLTNGFIYQHEEQFF